jgi:HSP20 family molecular chaperone IbpA
MSAVMQPEDQHISLPGRLIAKASGAHFKNGVLSVYNHAFTW